MVREVYVKKKQKQKIKTKKRNDDDSIGHTKRPGLLGYRSMYR